MSETKEEYQRGIYESRRRDNLRDMKYADLIDLIPSDAWADYKEHIIDFILEQDLDKPIRED